jgi:hypothetical protein
MVNMRTEKEHCVKAPWQQTELWLRTPTNPYHLYPYCTHKRFVGTVPPARLSKMIDSKGLFGERGGTRTHDPMIKSHVPVKQL